MPDFVLFRCQILSPEECNRKVQELPCAWVNEKKRQRFGCRVLLVTALTEIFSRLSFEMIKS